ncbi:hypothetical protein HJ526_08830 [Donghicola sp. C2-DW-16]|uniref:Uncharacterized protein n=1 Tax=Donghicola mangrovi TaxID=2729614 RepID=A0ABX2PDI7_9RHOB|nr:hypothetical protein [Donghicola mangrovi]NVO27520.1 hypothetical protein [Donghicola mangrovi]
MKVNRLFAAFAMFGFGTACASGALKNEYGGFNIAGTDGVIEQSYGQARGWNIVYGQTNGRAAYCAAETGAGDTLWRIGYDGGQWQVAIPYAPSGGSNDFQSMWEVDGVSRDISGISTDAWTFAWLGLPELDRVMQGNQMIIEIGRASVDRSLSGTAAAMAKVRECVAAKGVSYADPDGDSVAMQQPATGCPDDGPRLPGSNICQGRAANYLAAYPDQPPFAPDGQDCRWAVRQAELPGDRYLLYLAAQCGSKTAKLEFSGGNHRSDLMLVNSVYEMPEDSVAEIYAAHGAGANAILQRAAEWSEDPAEMAGCKLIRQSRDPLKYQVDNMGLAQSSDGPRASCGPRGYDGDSPNYWTVFGDEVWYIRPSIEMAEDIFMPSLTVLSKGFSGEYVASGN